MPGILKPKEISIHNINISKYKIYDEKHWTEWRRI